MKNNFFNLNSQKFITLILSWILKNLSFKLTETAIKWILELKDTAGLKVFKKMNFTKTLMDLSFGIKKMKTIMLIQE